VHDQVVGPDSLMAPKKHGTSDTPVQQQLRYGVDVKLADKICNFNRHYAENAGYAFKTEWLKQVLQRVADCPTVCPALPLTIPRTPGASGQGDNLLRLKHRQAAVYRPSRAHVRGVCRRVSRARLAVLPRRRSGPPRALA
jgi:hypothetical protein